jgi:hydroxymethylglutaryl-CoA lyase
MKQWPKVVYKEECMREGMQIEDVNIPVEQKVRLLDAISETGLKNIVVGSFVSPKYTPQMACIDEILRRFRAKPGVTYTALVANRQGEERARAYAPPLTLEREPVPYLSCTLCDVFVRRNFNRSQAQEIERWPQTIARAKERKLKAAGIAINAAWGSNFIGPFTLAQRIEMLEGEHALWDDVGIAVTHVNLGDPMSWNAPHEVEETLAVIKKRWPAIKHFKLHFHNARGMAMASTYAALQRAGGDRYGLLRRHHRRHWRLPLLWKRQSYGDGRHRRPDAPVAAHGHRNGSRSQPRHQLRVDARRDARAADAGACIQGRSLSDQP